jgi:uncharacterized protein
LSEENNSPSINRYWNAWITLAFGIAILLSYILVGVLVGIIVGVIEIRLNPQVSATDLTNYLTSREGLVVSLTSFASTVLGVGLIMIFIRARNRLSIVEYLGLQSIRIKTILGILGLTVILLLLSTALGTIFKIPNNNFDEQIYRTSVWPPLLWIALVICAPIFEESLFRGFLFEGFRRSKLGLVGTMIITALAWASLHIQYGVYEIVSIFVLGIILGIVRYRTRSLWATLLMHAGWNLAVTIQLAFTVGNLH